MQKVQAEIPLQRKERERKRERERERVMCGIYLICVVVIQIRRCERVGLSEM